MPDRGLVGKTFQNYRMDRFLGQGGMASVYQATDLRLQRPVAIKVMHPQYAAQDLFRQRFMQEARAIATLDHSNIVRVLSFDTIEGELFIVMELITGGSLRDYIKQAQTDNRFIDLETVLDLTIQMADALHYAHQQGLIHRDIKPDNVVLRPIVENEAERVQPILTDFGLAKLAESGDIYATDQPIGTYPYMSPEQCLAERVDLRSDVYSLGVMLYELTTLRLPYTPRSIAEAVRMHTREPLPKPSDARPGLPSALERVIVKALQKDPRERYQSAAELARALREVRETLQAADDEFDPLTATSIDLLSTQPMQAAAPELPPYFTPQPIPPDQVGIDRIVLYSENEPTMALPINKDVITIGRDSSRDVQLTGRLISRRHARIERGFDGKYRIVDLGSSNGTFLGDAQLIPNVAEVWSDDKPVRLADYWMRLELAAKSGNTAPLPAQRMTELEEPAGSLFISQSGGRRAAAVAPAPVAAPAPRPEPDRIGLTLTATLIRVTPGSQVTLALEVVNQSKLVDHFTVQVYGVPNDWITLPAAPLYLLPGARDTTSIEFHPPLAPSSTAGAHAFEVRVTARAQGIVSPAVQGALEIAPFYDFLADMEPMQIRRRGLIDLTLSNTSNIACTYNVTVRDKQKAMHVYVPGKQFTLMPGQTEYIDIRIRAKNRPLIGRAETKYFDVQVAPRDTNKISPKTMQGELIVPPYLPIVALTGLLVLLAVCGIITALLVPPVQNFLNAQATAQAVASVTSQFLTWTPTPSPTFTATATPIPTETGTFTPTPSPFPTIPGSAGEICPGSPSTRLRIGLVGRVTAGGLANRLRAEPGTAGALIGLMPPNSEFTIIGGPQCDTERFLRWWQVDFGGLIGWTAEGQGDVYYLEPPPTPGLGGNAFPPPGS
ncbi:MAG: protein kinase [bacterium]|nr:protein kinase [bacterium]